MINYTRPGRLHVIISRRIIYLTLWFMGKRYHWCRGGHL